MIIKFHGETSPNKLQKMIKEIVSDIQTRAEIEESKFTLKDVEVGILFNVNGEKMMLSSEIDGVKEPFKVHVQLDEKGNIKAKKDNENESFADEYEKAVARGFASPDYSEIKSVFLDVDLEFIDEVKAGDMTAKHYRHRITRESVVRYYKNGILVGEMGYKEKEGI